MSKSIDYYYSLVSPWVFLGHPQFLAMVGRTGASVTYRPITVAEIFPKTGGLPLAKRPPERRAYRMLELKRWSRHLGVKMNYEPKFFPADDRPAMNFITAAIASGADVSALSYRLMQGVWQNQENIADWDQLQAYGDAAGLDGAGLVKSAQSDEIAAQSQANCDAALTAGCFGVPWYSYNGEGFWGQDRIALLEEAMA